MDEHTFKKLTEMLRPILERNKYYASEKRERDRIKESRRISCLFPAVQQYNLSAIIIYVTFSVVQQYNLSAMKRNITFPVIQQCVYNWTTLYPGSSQCIMVLS